MRESRSEHQRADQVTERSAETLLVPSGGDLHSDRIDSGKEETCQESKQHQRTETVGEQINARVAQRAGERASQKDSAR